MQKREKGLAMVLAALVLVGFFSAGSAWGQAQNDPWFVVVPFVDAHTGNGDTSLLITNTGETGNMCANFYLFTTDGTMTGCCACPVKQNGLLTMSVNDLTKNPVSGAPQTTGVIKMLGSMYCDPAYPLVNLPGLKMYQRSLYASSVPSAVTPVPASGLSGFEYVTLQRQCTAIVKQSGTSGPGICQCPGGGPVGIPQ